MNVSGQLGHEAGEPLGDTSTLLWFRVVCGGATAAVRMSSGMLAKRRVLR
jgi:hypothetical protein